MDKELLAVAGGSKPADVVISNGRIVNVYTGEIYDGGVAISGQTIAAVGDVDYCVGEGTKIIDAEGASLRRASSMAIFIPKAPTWQFGLSRKRCSNMARHRS